MYKHYRIELIYFKWGKTFEFLGVIGVLIYSLIVPRQSLEASLKMLGWDRTTPEMIAGFSMFVATVLTLPVFVITYPVSPLFGGIATAMFFYSVGGFLYQLPDQFAFKMKYDFTFYTPLALEIVSVELLKHGNLSRAVETLASMNLGTISDLVRLQVVSPFYTQRRYANLGVRFIEWLQYECPSDVFSFYMLELVTSTPNEEQFRIIIDSAVNTIFGTLKQNLESSDWKISMGIYLITILDILISLGLTIGSGKILVQSVPLLAVLISIVFIFDIPLFTYVFISPVFRRLYVIDEIKV